MLIVMGFYVGVTPHVKIKISGPDPNNALEFDGVLDTGFDGFIMMPAPSALQLGLVSRVTTDVIMANAKTEPSMTASGTATIEDEFRTGTIILSEESTEVLIGMGLMRLFSLTLVVSRGFVALISEKELDKQAAAKAEQEAAAASAGG